MRNNKIAMHIHDRRMVILYIYYPISLSYVSVTLQGFYNSVQLITLSDDHDFAHV